jgi:UDP-N-acetylmuramoyl-L-alanyl-D-glutamate--2,6-diaminopimelate ligase
MRLTELVKSVSGARLRGGRDVPVARVEYDSRRAGPGAAFVAIRGLKTDGHDFVHDALAAGADAIVVQADQEARWAQETAAGVPVIVVPDTRTALPEIAAALKGHPARALGMIGVTGTDGKTTLSHLIAHVLNESGLKSGLVSTAGCRMGNRPLAATGRFTTPESPLLQGMLRQMVDAGCRWAVIEATSHGLALHRLDQCEFDIAAFTVIGADHLDFHGSVESYLAAKGLLFQMLDRSVDKGLPKRAVLNIDDPSSDYLGQQTRAAAVTYGLSDAADVRAVDVRDEGWSSTFFLRAPGAAVKVVIPRPGLFNVYNALAATAVALAVGVDLHAVRDAIATWPGAPGRTELIEEGQPFRVVVDFAHAPQSLHGALTLLRSKTRGRLIAVFGCIGERERDRRAAMGRAAAAAADYTFVTDDNPYTEDRMVILEEIAAGLRSAGRREGHDFAVVPDRREAIAQALGMAVEEDAVLLAGKGHETEVHLRGTSYACDDREVARKVLRNLGTGRRRRPQSNDAK